MEWNSKLTDDINRHCIPDSLLIIDRYGILHRIYCPFTAKALPTLPVLYIKGFCEVTSVRMSRNLMPLYLVEKGLFPYYHFIIIL